MQTFLFILAVLSAAYAVWSVLTFPFFWNTRKTKLRYAVFGTVFAFALLVGSIFARESADRSLGFAGTEDRTAAMSAGMPDARVWNQHKAALAASIEAHREQAAAEETAAKIASDKLAAEHMQKAKAAEDPAQSERASAGDRVLSEEAVEPAVQPVMDQCRQDLLCWAKQSSIQAVGACVGPIELLAKWDFEWTDTWSKPKFDRYLWKDQKRGIVTYIGSQLKLQNGFGAWRHVTYECDYDPTSQTAAGVQVY